MGLPQVDKEQLHGGKALRTHVAGVRELLAVGLHHVADQRQRLSRRRRQGAVGAAHQRRVWVVVQVVAEVVVHGREGLVARAAQRAVHGDGAAVRLAAVVLQLLGVGEPGQAAGTLAAVPSALHTWGTKTQCHCQLRFPNTLHNRETKTRNQLR